MSGSKSGARSSGGGRGTPSGGARPSASAAVPANDIPAPVQLPPEPQSPARVRTTHAAAPPAGGVGLTTYSPVEISTMLRRLKVPAAEVMRASLVSPSKDSLIELAATYGITEWPEPGHSSRCRERVQEQRQQRFAA